jgi:hypothetical protein
VLGCIGSHSAKLGSGLRCDLLSRDFGSSPQPIFPLVTIFSLNNLSGPSGLYLKLVDRDTCTGSLDCYITSAIGTGSEIPSNYHGIVTILSLPNDGSSYVNQSLIEIEDNFFG